MTSSSGFGSAGRLAGRVVAVTGAGRGIGRAYVLALAREGARVVVNDLGTDLEGGGRDGALAEEVVEEIQRVGGEAVSNHADVSTEDGARSVVEDALAAWGRLDAVVNNAAIEFRGEIEEHSRSVFERVLAVNVLGTFLCAKAAIPCMREQGGGVILNTTSGAFWEGVEGCSAYSASKAAIFSLTLSQHSELARYGIDCNCIAPNATRTRMVESWIARLARETDEPEEEVIRRWGIQSPENLAPVVTFLCSEAARGVSGNVLEVWGDRIVRIAAPSRQRSFSREADAWTFEELARGIREISG